MDSPGCFATTAAEQKLPLASVPFRFYSRLLLCEQWSSDQRVDSGVEPGTGLIGNRLARFELGFQIGAAQAQRRSHLGRMQAARQRMERAAEWAEREFVG